MHVTLVHVQVKPEFIDAFIEATQANHEQSVRESGNRRFDVLQDPAEATRFVLYEAYVDEAAAKAHRGTMHYQTWRDGVAQMMAEPRRGEPFVGLFPKG